MAACALAQATGTATMLGAVTDSSGSVVPGAKITVIQTGTNFTFTSTTTSEGTWYIPSLNSGTYQLKIEAPGFKTHVRDGIQLRTGESPRFDVALEVGSVTENVQVTGTAPLLETETSTSGQVLEGGTIEKIPVLQKAFYRIYLYMPGMNVINGQHAVGQRQRSLGFTIDGVNAKESVLGNPNSIDTVVTATLDMIQEFKMYTTGLPAEFGHSSGGQLNGVYKSGTNQLHGSAEDRYLPGKLVHRQYFEQLRRCQGLQVCNPFSYHEMSAIIGGPVVLPKIYNGKDKTFFFGGFQRHHEKVTETYTGTVPTPEMYAGDFSFGGRGFPIYDPTTTRQLENGTWMRDPFPGNIIPQSRIDPVIKNYLSHTPWKQPTDPGSLGSAGPANNLVVPSKGRYYVTRYDAKIDHQFNSNNRLYGRFTRVRERIPGRFFSSYELAWDLLDPVYFYPLDMTNIAVADTHTFSPTSINEFRFGFNRRHQTNDPPAQNGNWAQQLGIPNVSGETFPDFLNSSNNTRFYNAGPGGLSERIGQDYSFQENMTKIIGKHTTKFGYELLRTTYDSLIESFPSGRYFMGGTELPFTPNTGNAFASFLLGSVASAQFTRAQGWWAPRWFSHSVYFQDDWKPMRNLTLNLGLRWMYETPFNTTGLISQFDPNATDPLTGRTGAIVHNPGALAKRDLNNFQPRVGLAWNFRPKWVFRGNFGMITSDLLTSTLNNNFEEYLATANIQAPPGDPRPVFYLKDGPPADQLHHESGRIGAFHRYQLRRAQRDMVGPEYAESICNELVWRIPVSVHRTPGWRNCSIRGRPASAAEQLGHQRAAAERIERSRHAEPDSHRLPELQTIPAVRLHPALFELWSQHVSRGDAPSREALFARRNVELVLDVVQNDQRRGRGRRRQRHHLVQPAAGERPRGVRHQPPLRDDRDIRTAGRKRQAIHELGRLEERDLRRLGTGGITALHDGSAGDDHILRLAQCLPAGRYRVQTS